MPKGSNGTVTAHRRSNSVHGFATIQFGAADHPENSAQTGVDSGALKAIRASDLHAGRRLVVRS